MARNVAVLQHPTLPAALSELSTYGLTVVEIATVQNLVATYSTNVPTIRKMFDLGLELPEVEQVLETRARVNAQLGEVVRHDKDSMQPQTVSYKRVIEFQQRFRGVPLDADSLVELLLAINERLTGKYLDTMLGQLVRLGESFPDASPEALIDVLFGESDIPDD